MKLGDFYINYFFFIFIAGAILLAAIHHTILYLHRKTKLLSYYSTYLWCTFLYCFYRVFFPDHDPDFIRSFAPDSSLDESIQMLVYLVYVRFIGVALNLKKETDGVAYVFVEITPYVITGYVLLQYAFMPFHIPFVVATITAFIIRAYLLFLGFYMLLKVLKRRDRLFYNYLAAGAISMIFFGLVSSVTSIAPNETIIFSAASWLLFGFFFDVLFFSAAVGYNIKEEAIERENALKLVVQQQQELQLKELQKKEAVYQTQLNERLRMAKDLHDDIGATLSSISMYSEAVKNQVKEKLPHLEPVLNKIGENSREMVTNMSDIVWAINPNNDDGDKLVQRMESYARDICAVRGVQLDFESNEMVNDVKFSLEQRRNVYLVFKEALNNALKYSEATRVDVVINKSGNELNLVVKDNGKGFESGILKTGNGLKNMKLRAEEINATCTISSSRAAGTVVQLTCHLE